MHSIARTTLGAACWAFLAASAAYAEDVPPPLRPSQDTALAAIAAKSAEILEVNRALWEFAEVGLEEKRSSSLLIERLKAAGFEVQTGLADMPTAFVASYGSGQPVIAILAEYDALPGLSQKLSPSRDPLVAGAPGHGCGHCGLGAGTLGAALAIKQAMETHKLPGTLRIYGTPAEETVIGKVYMVLGKVFDDVDLCLHWHPSTQNEVWNGSSKAVVSAKFTFSGTAAHASATPQSGQSALDGVELMNVGANYMREHVKPDARTHYVITDGGGAPNVVPASATVWYFVRADEHRDVEANFRWLLDIAHGAGLMSRTKMSYEIDTDCHEIIPNGPLSQVLYQNLSRLAPPKYTDEELDFARRLQAPLAAEFGLTFDKPIEDDVERLALAPVASQGSTDVGDISWHVPTGGLRTTCFVAKSPGHSWQNVACIRSTIGEKGIVYAAQILALSALDLFETPALVAAAKEDWQKRMQGRKYTSLIPAGQKPPVKIR